MPRENRLGKVDGYILFSRGGRCINMEKTVGEMNIVSDEEMMRRALQLAANGALHASPNPMVGAVVTARGRIIGEGWHRQWGGPHAEVNAIASVREEDRHLLSESTIYVTLEPCSHYGKTPPCSKLIIETGIPKVVVGSTDPFKEVSGRGIRMLREAGIEVTVGVLEQECRALNRRFMTAHTYQRPYITLKWAESSDSKIGGYDEKGNKTPAALSNELSMALMHRERAMADAILVGTDTVISDNPSLTVREWPGKSPRPVIFDSRRLPSDAKVLSREPVMLDPMLPLEENMYILYKEYGITSLLVEGGAETLRRFIEAGLYDSVRVERTQKVIGEGTPAPILPSDLDKQDEINYGSGTITTYLK